MIRNAKLSWPITGSIPPLALGTVQVWAVNLDLPQPMLDKLFNWLSADEKSRVARLKFPLHQQRLIASRACLRYLLASFLHCLPSEVHLSYGAYGKPFVEAALEFNSSDTQHLTLIAFSPNLPVGIDVEYCRRQVEALTLAERFFSELEIQALKALPEQHRMLAFYHIWTRKEAFIKALGQGLSFPLADFSVSSAAEEPAILLEVNHDPAQAHNWQLVNLTPGQDFVAALAVNSATAVEVLCCQLDTMKLL